MAKVCPGYTGGLGGREGWIRRTGVDPIGYRDARGLHPARPVSLPEVRSRVDAASGAGGVQAVRSSVCDVAEPPADVGPGGE
jgi:hypothetical protein